MTKISAIALASAVAGAIALAGAAGAQTKASFKCFGIAKAGQNDCANAAKTHSCAGQSKINYDLADWKNVKDGAECTTMGGMDKAGKGVNPKAPKS